MLLAFGLAWTILGNRSMWDSFAFTSVGGPEITITAFVLAFCGVAFAAFDVAALSHVSGGGASAPEAFLNALRRLPSFMAMWALVSTVVGFPLVIVVPGVLIYIGLSMADVVFFAEGLGPLAAMGRSWRLAWRKTVRLRIVQLTAAGFVLEVCMAVILNVLLGVLVARFLPDYGLWGPRPSPAVATTLLFAEWGLVALPTVFIVPVFTIARAVLYRHAVLLYPPTQSRGPHTSDAAQPGGDA